MAVLSVDRLSGGYHRRKPVIHDLSFTVGAKEMVGLIGLNGAGKSTTMKHILGLLMPHGGEIRIGGTTLGEAPERYRGAFAFVPESPLLYEELTVREHLRLSAMAYGLTEDVYAERAELLLRQFQMKSKADSFSSHLSKGMRQKLMIMSAFLVRPSLYMIDEPFLGLDPLGIRSLLDLLVREKEAGAGILMSSHILSTIEKYCDRFLVMHQGRLIASGTLDDVCRTAGCKPGTGLEEAFYALVKDGNEGWI